MQLPDGNISAIHPTVPCNPLIRQHDSLRAISDLLRKRAQLVQQRTTHILSIQNLYARNTGCYVPPFPKTIVSPYFA